MESRGVFREIHKNTWLKRLSSDGRKLSTGNKRNDKFWVVFCVHDDCEALLEGYAEPRLAASHQPEWTVSLQTTMHVSHALVPTEQEYEFVVTLNSDVIRFCAPTWECMQEWVEALRSKLREMKILSPKENVYSKLPEIRPPLLPTRDPTSPLPPPPPVPAAIVAGIECVVPPVIPQISSVPSTSHQSESSTSQINDIFENEIVSNTTIQCSNQELSDNSELESFDLSTSSILPTTMTNTTPQSLINLLSNPIQAYSNQNSQKITKKIMAAPIQDINSLDLSMPSTSKTLNAFSQCFLKSVHNHNSTQKLLPDNHSMAKIFTDNVLSEPNRGSSSSLAKSSSNSSSMAVDFNLQNLISEDSNLFNDDNDLETSSMDSPTSTFKTKPLIIPRPQTSKSQLSNEKKLHRKQSSNNVTATNSETTDENESIATNITIIQVSNSTPLVTKPIMLSSTAAAATPSTTSDIFNFNINQSDINDEEKEGKESYNVHILPSNDIITNNNIQIKNNNLNKIDQYSTPKKMKTKLSNTNDQQQQQITTVHVHSPNTSYITPTSGNGTTINKDSIIESQKIIVSANSPTQMTASTVTPNFSSVTSISVGADLSQPQQQHYEQVFLSTSSPLSIHHNNSFESKNSITSMNLTQLHHQQQPHKPSSPLLTRIVKKQRSTSQSEIDINQQNIQKNSHNINNVDTSISNKENNSVEINSINIINTPSTSGGIGASSSNGICSSGSGVTPIFSETKRIPQQPYHQPQKPRPTLMRGLTELAISRQSRIDKGLNRGRNKSHVATTTTDVQTAIDKFKNDTQMQEQRKRSSSTSDANTTNANGPMQQTRHMQAPPQPFRPQDNPQSGRLSLREQQVMQLRREMMHPGGVRLQLRRKECISSIAWSDAFGAVWVAGWKQKEHPMLYNALHIGDQLISIGAVTINSAADANKIIRTSPGLYVELIVRRVPFGRVYAIRRDMEGQCLGLIRDGNTATIVDVVPNSLAARHGLPPKTKSCDGLSLSFWVLTEINGRPLNLFFKEFEVRDRLNAVGRDISILVQPLDLVTKLKKQLKSLRGYKDYIVQ